ncbi:hypothetical protein ACOV11_12510 [Vibrio natriegens]
MNIIVVPKHISKGVFVSQMLPLYDYSLEKSILYFRCPTLRIKYEDVTEERTTISSPLYLIKRCFNLKSIYCRSVFDMWFCFLFKLLSFGKVKFIYDFRGLISEESFLRKKSLIRYYLLYLLEYNGFVFGDEVRCVSNKMKRTLISRYGDKEIRVIPCCIKAEEINYFDEKPDGIINFCYVGSISAWQCFEESIKMYSSLNISNKKLYVYTKDLEKAEQIIVRYNVDSYEILSLERHELLERLKNIHFGFVLRRDCVVNNTASPIKFLEYCSQGVIPITTSYVGDYSNDFSPVSIIFESIESVLTPKLIEQKMKSVSLEDMYKITKKHTWESYYRIKL